MTEQYVQASAPGKLVLAGEYAVLDGAPALCMAVDRRAVVSIAPGDGDHHTVTAPGHTDVAGAFRGTRGDCEWHAGADAYGLVEQVWRAAEPVTMAPLAIKLDTRQFSDPHSGVKLGIGSSAALTVALAAALSEVAETSADARSVAYAAHRQLQGGLGSGVDVACCSAGGLIEYRLAGAAVQPRSWPDGLHYALLWSGVSASTSARLRRLESGAASASRATLAAAAQRVAAAWGDADAAQILEEYRAYVATLQAFSIDHELGIFDAGHAETRASAAAAGLVYKPCGAGGGDMGIVLGADPAAIEAFVGSALPAEFQVMNMTIDPGGVRVERGQD